MWVHGLPFQQEQHWWQHITMTKQKARFSAKTKHKVGDGISRKAILIYRHYMNPQIKEVEGAHKKIKYKIIWDGKKESPTKIHRGDPGEGRRAPVDPEEAIASRQQQEEQLTREPTLVFYTYSQTENGSRTTVKA